MAKGSKASQLTHILMFNIPCATHSWLNDAKFGDGDSMEIHSFDGDLCRRGRLPGLVHMRIPRAKVRPGPNETGQRSAGNL